MIVMLEMVEICGTFEINRINERLVPKASVGSNIKILQRSN